MDKNELQKLSYDELRAVYKGFLHNQNLSKLTVNTAYSDTFYLWRKGSKKLFWDAVMALDFENEAKATLIKVLTENSTGDVNSNINGYMSHLRRFRLFLDSDGTAESVVIKQKKTSSRITTRKKKMDINIPEPSIEQVDYYLEKWKELENYRLQ